MYCLVIPFGKKTFDSIGYTYLVPDGLKETLVLGHVVEISFKEEITLGIVYSFLTDNSISFDVSKIKPIISINNDFIFLDGYRLTLLKYISERYFTPIHNSLNLFLPKNLIEKLKKGKLSIPQNTYNYKNIDNLELNSFQKEVFDKINLSKNNKILLFGVTGSGKTHIYINMINEVLKKGNQSLLLIPEIILGNQIFKKIKSFFGDEVLLINSTVTDATRSKYFLDIANGSAKIIIGTRSALFYPYKNLDLIIMDEEHDNSYISDQSPRYNSIDIVNKITDLNHNKLILGSGTPSVESMYKGIKGDYEVIHLFEKYKTD